MSSRVDEYLNKESAAEAQYLKYGFMAFVVLVLMKYVTESAGAKRNRQTKKNKMLFEATKMKHMMSMATAARGGGGGGGGSNKE